MGSLHRPMGESELIRVDHAALGWQFLEFAVLSLSSGEKIDLDTACRETAIVPIAGAGVVEFAGQTFELRRHSVFTDVASVLYVPPGGRAFLSASTDWLVAIGSAPAEGRYPVRLVEPTEMKVEIRGGGPALRQVNHVLAPPLPAERLIVYEVFVPGGAWAGWPPHCHDGLYGSPYLEETYLFRFDSHDGFGFHRNYLADRSFEEFHTVGDLDCVAVPCGFHVTTCSPGSTMWILNFLAGDLVGEDRATPPYFDPSTTWITADWSKGQATLPIAVDPAAKPANSRPRSD
jgi:5-deoxy-glucuronate isomerase